MSKVFVFRLLSRIVLRSVGKCWLHFLFPSQWDMELPGATWEQGGWSSFFTLPRSSTFHHVCCVSRLIRNYTINIAIWQILIMWKNYFDISWVLRYGTPITESTLEVYCIFITIEWHIVDVKAIYLSPVANWQVISLWLHTFLLLFHPIFTTYLDLDFTSRSLNKAVHISFFQPCPPTLYSGYILYCM